MATFADQIADSQLLDSAPRASKHCDRALIRREMKPKKKGGVTVSRGGLAFKVVVAGTQLSPPSRKIGRSRVDETGRMVFTVFTASSAGFAWDMKQRPGEDSRCIGV